MAYMSDKAPGRNTTEPGTSSVRNKASNQEQFTGTGAKSMGNPPAGSNQVKFAANTKGTGTLKNALNSYKQTNLPAAVNPGPEGNSQTATKKAPGRN